MIAFGSVEYFELLMLRDKLENRNLDKLDLITLDRLRTEVETKIEAINLQENERREKLKNRP